MRRMSEWLIRGLRVYNGAGANDARFDAKRWPAGPVFGVNVTAGAEGRAAERLFAAIIENDPAAVVVANDGRFAIPLGIPPDHILNVTGFIAAMPRRSL